MNIHEKKYIVLFAALFTALLASKKFDIIYLTLSTGDSIIQLTQFVLKKQYWLLYNLHFRL